MLFSNFKLHHHIIKKIYPELNNNNFQFDRFSDGFFNHIERDHNLWNYIFYIYFIKTKDPNDYNGIESYIAEKVIFI